MLRRVRYVEAKDDSQRGAMLASEAAEVEAKQSLTKGQRLWP